MQNVDTRPCCRHTSIDAINMRSDMPPLPQGLLKFESWGSSGGWKANAFKMETPALCTTLKHLVPNLWRRVRANAFGDPNRECPIPPVGIREAARYGYSTSTCVCVQQGHISIRARQQRCISPIL